MDETAAIERITETENLTDSLEDDDANWLLDWGIEHVHDLISNITDEEAAGEKVHHLMAVMRKLNQIVGDRTVKTPSDLAADVQEFVELYTQAFGQAKPPEAAAPLATATTIKEKPPRETMQTLIDLVTLQTPETPPKAPDTPIKPAKPDKSRKPAKSNKPNKSNKPDKPDDVSLSTPGDSDRHDSTLLI